MDIDVIVYCGIIISVELCNFYGVRMLSIYIMNYYMYKIYIQVEIIYRGFVIEIDFIEIGLFLWWLLGCLCCVVCFDFFFEI